MPKCPLTSAEMSCCRSVLVPKCLGSEVSGYPANTTNTFKARLGKFWHNQDVVYDFKAQLQGTGSRSKCLYDES